MFTSRRYSLKKKTTTWWLNDKTMIALGYCKKPWFVSVSQLNHDILLNLVQELLIILSLTIDTCSKNILTEVK